MAKCIFCGYMIPQGTGKQVIQTDGKILDICSRKCEKNMLQLKRKARTLKWTKHYPRSKE